ncbi:polymer-forming cytoskeletal protein [bacterium]|nr:polymer-forming cytoskeletal protein [bacterium]
MTPKDASTKAAATGLLSKGCRVSGKLVVSGRFQIDGNVDGEVRADGELTVGESGLVDARISGQRVRVFGRVNGDIDCFESLELCSGARVYGNIKSPVVKINEGVVFQGHCAMTEK